MWVGKSDFYQKTRLVQGGVILTFQETCQKQLRLDFSDVANNICRLIDFSENLQFYKLFKSQKNFSHKLNNKLRIYSPVKRPATEKPMDPFIKNEIEILG